MKNRILFPFFYQSDNRQRYVETLEIAKKTNAEVVLFTSISEDAKEEEFDNVYLHLLELNGFYQTTQNDWRANNIQFKRVIGKGDMSMNLQSYLEKSNNPTKIVARPSYPKFNTPVLKKLLEKLSIPPNMIVN